MHHLSLLNRTPDGQDTAVGQDYLVHFSHIKQQTDHGFKTLQEGSKVEFETAVDPKNPDKIIAINVTGVGGGDCEKRERRHHQRGGNYGGSRGRFDNQYKDDEASGLTVFIYADPNCFNKDYNGDNKPISWQNLKDLFSKCGRVNRADVLRREGFGIVRFSNAEDAKSSIEQNNGTTLHGFKLEVRSDKKK